MQAAETKRGKVDVQRQKYTAYVLATLITQKGLCVWARRVGTEMGVCVKFVS
jgi:hypothetical protein